MREVDIVVEAPIAGHLVTVGIECIEQGRPASVEWIDKMHGKHRDTEIDKLVLISKSGFSVTAKASAASLGYEALTLDEAEAVDWTHTIHLQQRMTLRSHAFEIKDARMTLVRPSGETLRELTLDDYRTVMLTGAVLKPDGTHLRSFSELINGAFYSQSALEQFERLTIEDELRLLRMEMDFVPGTHFLDPDGQTRFLKKFWAVFQFKRLDDVVQFTQAAYGDARVAHATGSLQGRSVTIVVTEQQGHDAQVGVVVEKR
jgi:hypothetical protein